MLHNTMSHGFHDSMKWRHVRASPPASHLVGEHALWNTFELMGGHIGSTLPSAGGGEGGGQTLQMYPTITL